jgi:hypothetical protein
MLGWVVATIIQGQGPVQGRLESIRTTLTSTDPSHFKAPSAFDAGLTLAPLGKPVAFSPEWIRSLVSPSALNHTSEMSAGKPVSATSGNPVKREKRSVLLGLFKLAASSHKYAQASKYVEEDKKTFNFHTLNKPSYGPGGKSDTENAALSLFLEETLPKLSTFKY